MATPNYNDPRAGTNAFSIGQQELLRLKNRIKFIEEAFNELDDDPTDAIPTKLSELQNDVGFITAEDIPEFPEGTIPTKTSDLTNDSGYITSEIVNDIITDTFTDAVIYNKTGTFTEAASNDHYFKIAVVPSNGTVTKIKRRGGSMTGTPSVVILRNGTVVTIKAITKTVGVNAEYVTDYVTIPVLAGDVIYLGGAKNSVSFAILTNSTDTDDTISEFASSISIGSTPTLQDANDIHIIFDCEVTLRNDYGFITTDYLPSKTSELTNDSGYMTSSGRIANIETWKNDQSGTYGADYNIRAVWNGNSLFFKCINPSSDSANYNVIVDDALHVPWSGVTGAPAFLTEAQVRAIVSEMMG